MFLKVLTLSVIVTICLARNVFEYKPNRTQHRNSSNGGFYRMPRINNTNEQTRTGTDEQIKTNEIEDNIMQRTNEHTNTGTDGQTSTSGQTSNTEQTQTEPDMSQPPDQRTNQDTKPRQSEEPEPGPSQEPEPGQSQKPKPGQSQKPEPGLSQETEQSQEADENNTPSPPTTSKTILLTPAEIEMFQQNLRLFSAAVYQKINEKNGANNNIFFSPLSISHVMGMVNTGARGNSSAQIRKSLMMAATDSNAFIDTAFENITKDKFGLARDPDVIALMAAKSYFMTGFIVREQYATSLAKFYHSVAEAMNFNQKENSADRINGWVEHQTMGLIKDLISPDMLTPLTKLVLVNVLYFKAPWTRRFTELPPADFTTPTGVVKVPYLYNKVVCKRLEKDGYEYLAVPYKDMETFFVIVMPKTDKDMENFESESNLSDFFKFLDRREIMNWRDQKLSLYMPAFTLEKSLNVKEILQTMGVRDIFSSSKADLSGVAKEFIYVTDVVHKARITVGKDGTEAAAATAAISVGRTIIYLETVKINRPFIFAVYERGNILFMGKMVNPSGK